MAQLHFDRQQIRRLVIEGCRGDVRIEGGDRDQVEISGDRSLSTRVHEASGQITIQQYSGNLSIQIGRDTTVVGQRLKGDISIEDVDVIELDRVAGDLSVENAVRFRANDVGGDLQLEFRDSDGETELAREATIGRVSGDLRAERVSSFRVNTVGGDLRVASSRGMVQIERVGGDCHVTAASLLQLGAVGGDATLSEIQGLRRIDRVGGDLDIQWTGNLDGDVSTTVGGDAAVELTGEAALVLRATVHGSISGEGATPRVADDEQGDRSEGDEDDGDWAFRRGGELDATYGDGGSTWQLTVGGDLELEGGTMTQAEFRGEREPDFAFDDFGLGDEMRRLGRDMKAMARELAREIRTAHHMPGSRPRIHMQINDKAFHFDAEQIDRITREAREAAAAGVARAQEAVERALVNIVSGKRPPMPPRPPRAPRGPRGPISSYTGQTVRIEREAEPRRSEEEIHQEKLAILRMISEGRLSVDEAEVMLRALEENR
jgi:hypothetical protein